MIVVSMCFAVLSTMIAVVSLCLVVAVSLRSVFQLASDETLQQNEVFGVQNQLGEVNKTLFSRVNFNKLALENLTNTIELLATQQQNQINAIKDRLDEVNNTLFSHMNFNKLALENLINTSQLLDSSTLITTDQPQVCPPSCVVPDCGTGTWHRVVYLNMSDSSQHCPPAWREYTTPVRSCGRQISFSGSCSSAVFSVSEYPFPYSKVCGRAIGYQYVAPDAFSTIDLGFDQIVTSVDDMYVDGISVTHGNPRTHIWTFAAGYTESLGISNDQFGCPCASSSANSSPSFVGENYFCESGTTREPFLGDYFSNDPLWDGEGCVNSQCCTFNAPPWFSVQLPSSTNNDIEVRICADESTSNEDTPVEILEMYVQ